MMMPMLGRDMQSLRAWLLADLGAIGMEPGDRLARAAARSQRWRDMSRRQAGLSSVEWSAAPRHAWWALLRQALFFSHLGWPTGRQGNSADLEDTVAAIVLLGALNLLGVFLWAFTVHFALQDLMGRKIHAMELVSWGSLLAMLVIVRGLQWLAMGEERRDVFKAQAAQPIWMWGWRRAAGFIASLRGRQAYEPATEMTFEVLSSAIERASLGQSLTPEEEAVAQRREAQRERVVRSIAAASDPDASLSLREVGSISGAISPAATLGSASAKRI